MKFRQFFCKLFPYIYRTGGWGGADARHMPREDLAGKICTNVNNKAATCDGLYSPTNTVHGRISVSSVYYQQPQQHKSDNRRLSKQDVAYYFSLILQTGMLRRSRGLQERSLFFRILEKKQIDNSTLVPRETSPKKSLVLSRL